MKKNLFIITLVLLVGSLLPHPLLAQIEQVILRVDGLACPFCAYGLEKKCIQLDGVTNYDADLREGKVYVDLTEDVKIDLNAFRKAVKEAGFTLRHIFLRAKGSIEKTETGFTLVVGGSHEPLLLFESEKMVNEYHQGENPQNLVLGKDLSEKLAEYALKGKEVLIEGAVHEHAGLPAGLAVERMEIL